jgi:hypothetical protein
MLSTLVEYLSLDGLTCRYPLAHFITSVIVRMWLIYSIGRYDAIYRRYYNFAILSLLHSLIPTASY